MEPPDDEIGGLTAAAMVVLLAGLMFLIEAGCFVGVVAAICWAVSLSSRYPRGRTNADSRD